MPRAGQVNLKQPSKELTLAAGGIQMQIQQQKQSSLPAEHPRRAAMTKAHNPVAFENPATALRSRC
jgi:hypothetical protein